MSTSTTPDLAAALARDVAWQNRWLTARLDFLRTDLLHYLHTGEPATEDDLRRWLHELALTQQLLVALPEPADAEATPVGPEPAALLYGLQAARHGWEAQFPGELRGVIGAIGS